MRFEPRFCPRAGCPSRAHPPFRFRFQGRFHRRCDGRFVQRFLCCHCRRTFSSQTFRLDYRLKRPGLHLELFRDFVSKVTQRQSARIRGCTRRTVARRLELLGRHCQDFHRLVLARKKERGGLAGVFQVDELETYEHNRRLKPLTIPTLIERNSFFVVHAECAPLPARGGLNPAWETRKEERESRQGKRRSGSRAAVRRCFQVLREHHDSRLRVQVQTDRKSSYGPLLREQFGERFAHARYSSKARRDYRNPLFPINFVFAMARDGMSRLVRRNWAGTKKDLACVRHAWIWIAWRNYVRAITNSAPDVSSAMALGVSRHMWSIERLLAWRCDLRD